VIITLLLALGVPCSAQLGVILGMLSDVGPVATITWVALMAGVIPRRLPRGESDSGSRRTSSSRFRPSAGPRWGTSP